MPLSLFGTIHNYAKMLRKIALFSFIFSAFAVHLLRTYIPNIDNFLKPFSPSITVFNVSLPLGTFLPAFLFALISRIMKLHDRISDIFKIRKHFDSHHILLPMFKDSGANNAKVDLNRLREKRNELMSQIFYKYASSSPSKSVIDTHYVTMALDNWSWFWIVQEAAIIALFTSIIFLFTGMIGNALIGAVVILLCLFLLFYIWKGCINYARQEIDQIFDQPNTKDEVSGVFNAL